MPLWVGEIILVSILIIVSVVGFILAGDFGGTINPLDVGPAAFPRLMLGVLMILCVIQLFISFRRLRRLRAEGKPDKIITLGNKVPVIGAAVFLILYGFAMPNIGFYISTPIFMLVVMWLAGTRNWKTLVFVPTGVVVFVYLVFYQLLGIVLP